MTKEKKVKCFCGEITEKTKEKFAGAETKEEFKTEATHLRKKFKTEATELNLRRRMRRSSRRKSP
jgi:hypothetical protein